MKLLKLITSLSVVLVLGFSTLSCTEKKSENVSKGTEMKNNDGHDHEHSEEVKSENNNMNDSEMDQTNMDMDMQKSNKSDTMIKSYLQLKNALVYNHSDDAANTAKSILRAFKSFNSDGFSDNEQKELVEIFENAIEQAEHIVKNANNIEHQREHFEVMSNDMIDLLAIIGSDETLYQTRCPMYNNGKGGIWLSETKEIRNPFYGIKMLTCGSVQKEI